MGLGGIRKKGDKAKKVEWRLQRKPASINIHVLPHRSKTKDYVRLHSSGPEVPIPPKILACFPHSVDVEKGGDGEVAHMPRACCESRHHHVPAYRQVIAAPPRSHDSKQLIGCVHTRRRVWRAQYWHEELEGTPGWSVFGREITLRSCKRVKT